MLRPLLTSILFLLAVSGASKLLADPPEADFSVDHTLSCNGTFEFEDLSNRGPTNWEWDFGDGTTSAAQNPTHTYSSPGTYTVELIASNFDGSDTIEKLDLVTYDPSLSTPSSTSCTPNTQNSQSGFGIHNLSFNDIEHSSDDAATEGYQDNTCYQTELYVGQNYTLSMVTDTPTTHNAKAWIDFDDDGVLDNSSEVVLDQQSVNYPTDSFMIPTTAVTDTPLLMRVMADYDVGTPPLTPCTDPQYGQAEDYTVRILQNPFPPVADFSVSDSVDCDGTVQFFDESQNVPTSWQWNFGDGNSSIAQDPVHTYNSSGTYNVRLIASNSNGTDTIIKNEVLEIDLQAQVKPPSCTPTTLSYCCDYGIHEVELNGVQGIKRSTDNASEGYRDLSCGSNTELIKGQDYNISIETGPNNQQDTRVWIDLDSSGTFEQSEMVFEALDQIDPNGTIQIPTNSVTDVPLRMRVISDHIGSDPQPCKDPQNGQAEDYGVTIIENTNPPEADFEVDSNYTCSGTVHFTDLSQYAPDSWEWDFGDGETSTAEDPTHVYTSSGDYTVSLIASNNNGSDTVSKVNYIEVDLGRPCDTIHMPRSGTGSSDECRGTLMDDGGTGEYSQDSDGSFTISPVHAGSVTLNFQSFHMEEYWDSLIIYDGPTTNSPRIGAYTGPLLPEGGNITSSGPSVTLEQVSDGSVQELGFHLTWNCSVVSLKEDRRERPELELFPNPVSKQLHVRSQGGRTTFERVTIFDSHGSLMERIDTHGKNELRIDAGSWKPGLYLLRWQGSEGSVGVRRFVVE